MYTKLRIIASHVSFQHDSFGFMYRTYKVQSQSKHMDS